MVTINNTNSVSSLNLQYSVANMNDTSPETKKKSSEESENKIDVSQKKQELKQEYAEKQTDLKEKHVSKKQRLDQQYLQAKQRLQTEYRQESLDISIYA
ncbi:MAG: hypothetical protein KAR45_12570 [Desulfobacteraceae bacterium]|nr:hypothetical protein [Desulfobacteraceae bacterium]